MRTGALRTVPAGPEHQDLLIRLLHAAVQAAHAAEQLERFAATDPGDPVAAADLVEAIEALTRTRSGLIAAAEELTARLEPPGS